MSIINSCLIDDKKPNGLECIDFAIQLAEHTDRVIHLVAGMRKLKVG
jgi:hypothetical protein